MFLYYFNFVVLEKFLISVLSHFPWIVPLVKIKDFESLAGREQELHGCLLLKTIILLEESTKSTMSHNFCGRISFYFHDMLPSKTPMHGLSCPIDH
ncbi:hypothetical protein VNO78_03078 [Psophocarpus tetragonolobus]|uniref:Uncharacterized protein n=1 Tax=Psophocarpus tetragonolobus TaxID=3891 RepID=A0AAN9T3P9_PSOTE